MNIWLAIESLTFGLAYSAGLCWVSVCILASFRPNSLSAPYWSGIRGLRSDTCGILAFFSVAIFLTCSEFLRLRRRTTGITKSSKIAFNGWISLAMYAFAETIAVLATGMIIYLSVNSITHPMTLGKQATHLMSWPSEGTLRVIALTLSGCSVGMLRFMRSKRNAGRESYLKTSITPSANMSGTRAV